MLTIHNLAHQQLEPAGAIVRVGLPRETAEYPGPFEFHGHCNLLKAGILAADHVNTVSPTYAREVVADAAAGCGLHGVLAARGEAFDGILNGVDTRTWDPASDRHLPARYHTQDLVGKSVCRSRLLHDAGLEEDPRPLLGVVSRLVPQKGIDLVVDLADRLVDAGCSLVVLGTGDAPLQDQLAAAAARHPGRVAFRPEFSESWAHRIYAGSDLFLMPSRFEPCGLGQLYALRYGTPPVVRRTGGLADTIADAGTAAGGTGFVFDEPTPDALWQALVRARATRDDTVRWRAMQRRGMQHDVSWEVSAAAYAARYRRLVPVAVEVGP
jgi:starch synthase